MNTPADVKRHDEDIHQLTRDIDQTESASYERSLLVDKQRVSRMLLTNAYAGCIAAKWRRSNI